MSRLEADVRMHKNEVRELNAILDTATDGLAVLDSQGRILALNRSGEALFGYDQSEVAGQAFTDADRAGEPGQGRGLFRRPENEQRGEPAQRWPRDHRPGETGRFDPDFHDAGARRTGAK